MEERYSYVVELLSKHKELLEFIANRLLEIETMEGSEFYEIVKGEAHCLELAQKAKDSQTNEQSSEETKADAENVPDAKSADNDKNVQ